MSQRFYTRTEVRARLGITKYRYQQLIATGLLAAPIRLSENSHPLHTESQIQEADLKIQHKSNPAPKGKSMISDRMWELIQSGARR